jgi:hypothetical protein
VGEEPPLHFQFVTGFGTIRVALQQSPFPSSQELSNINYLGCFFAIMLIFLFVEPLVNTKYYEEYRAVDYLQVFSFAFWVGFYAGKTKTNGSKCALAF